MALPPPARRAALTVHVLASIGWFGAVAVFLALALTGLTGDNTQLVRASDIALGPIGSYVVLPLCLASLVTGLVSSLGTSWGLLRHYWVVAKLVLTGLSTLMLLMHMRPIDRISRAALDLAWTPDATAGLRGDLALKAGAALVVLAVATVFALYKPRGMTRYGQRRQYGRPKSATDHGSLTTATTGTTR